MMISVSAKSQFVDGVRSLLAVDTQQNSSHNAGDWMTDNNAERCKCEYCGIIAHN